MEFNDHKKIQSRSISDRVLNNLSKKLLQKIQPILGKQLLGMYIGGSIAINSFNEETSDIDCYIVTTEILSQNIISQIESMHKKFYADIFPYAKKIEVSYISQHDLLSFNPAATRPYFNEGNFHLAHYGNNFLIELSILRENGITILGPEIKELIKEISKQELQQAIRKNLSEYWEPLLNDLSKLSRSDYQVFAVLTMCRTLYSLATGTITSKLRAAQWVINNDTNRKELIEKVLSWKPGVELDKLNETQKLIKYVLAKSYNDKL